MSIKSFGDGVAESLGSWIAIVLVITVLNMFGFWDEAARIAGIFFDQACRGRFTG